MSIEWAIFMPLSGDEWSAESGASLIFHKDRPDGSTMSIQYFDSPSEHS